MLLFAFFLVLNWTIAVAQSIQHSEINGHILRSESQIPLQNVLVVAWPCGQITATDRFGFYQIECPVGIDSITCSASFFETQTVLPGPGDHVDIWLNSLDVQLDQVSIESLRSPEPEAQRLLGRDLMHALDRTPGLQSLDLGDAMMQPVVRGLVGSRVALLEDGVPQQGGRWGADHGILADPVLYGSMEWVPGGGHLWMGPESVGGGLRLMSPKPSEKLGEMTECGASFRQGDQRVKTHALHSVTKNNQFWYVGVSGSAFGNQNIPQTSFSYLGRSYALADRMLPNTSGRSIHGVAGLERLALRGHKVEGSIRVSDVVQGLFPGIVGVPRQGDLDAQPQTYLSGIPQQHATRVQTTGSWKSGASNLGSSRSVKASLAWNRRLELAPPHAHGWGPEPDSNLSLSLDEWTGFLESVRRGPHGTWGMQLEGLVVATSGWEFLLPSHRRIRGSVLGEKSIGIHQLGIRADLVGTEQVGHEEPLYDADGSIVGSDRRAEAMQRLIPGGMVSWLMNVEPTSSDWTGTASVVIYTRAPSNYELGAHGIHHGTFRFEQGNEALRSEKAVEARFQASSAASETKWNWRIQAFSALHRDFIALGPSAKFAPISHAGQVYTFEAVNAFRTGFEASLKTSRGAWSASADGSLLGQWDVATGLGLPFTTPAQVYSTVGRSIRKHHQLTISCRAIADANLTARNEAPTEGTLLWGVGWSLARKAGTWSINLHNASNTAWLDHTSAYRALGLVAQGRWMQISFTTLVKQSNKIK
jgi:iron complex outermembrane receptor protein